MTRDLKAIARHPHAALLTRAQLGLYLLLLEHADDLGRLSRGVAVATARAYAGDQGAALLTALVDAGFLDRYPPGGLVADLGTVAA